MNLWRGLIITCGCGHNQNDQGPRLLPHVHWSVRNADRRDQFSCPLPRLAV